MRLYIFLFTLLFSQSARSAAMAPDEKILLVRVNDIGLITVGRDTVGSDQLARYIQERLFKSYLGTGKMYDRIMFESQGDQVPAEVANAVIGEIRDGQNKALQELCLQKFERTFEMLDKRKKDRLRKQFPVLFQEQFIQNT
ncbi:MAG: hypothetical protein U0U70_09360 [Chitinophagaceae bacterium]